MLMLIRQLLLLLLGVVTLGVKVLVKLPCLHAVAFVPS